MSWGILIFAGLFEVAWATGLKYSHGFTRLYPSIFTLVTMFISFGLLSIAMRSLPLGTAYAVWTGIGSVGAVLMGIFIFHDPATAPRIACLAMIIIGIIGLKVIT
ncbi:MAG: quaternary ammonium compound efflux SMR transporter SugE [Deferribacteraceae bacterium]|jgi:quaternary ammonium compound-resistance protein SugE|nr:quaternary ammonium compound efflux SMR transporter SugE [Deferribacteraceae bacterium]